MAVFNMTGKAGSSGGGTDTSDATAYPEHILKDYTAYARGAKITGTYDPEEHMIVKMKESPVMTSANTPPPWIVTTSGAWNTTNYGAWNVFNGRKTITNDNVWVSNNGSFNSGVGSAYVQIDLSEATRITSFIIKNSQNGGPRDFKLFGSNDGSTWYELHSVVDRDAINYQVDEYVLAAPETYRHYRLTTTKLNTTQNYMWLGQFELWNLEQAS